MSSVENLVWVEKYRPRKLEDCILPSRIKNQLREMVSKDNVLNYSAVGLSGSGKTSSIRAICEELKIDYILINMSNENGIDTVRNKIVKFASTMSFTSDYKLIILDEFDFANCNSTQPALRGVIDEFQSNCRFVITANYKSKIIDAMFSRCPMIDFNFNKEERKEMCLQFISRIEDILKENEVAYDRNALAKFCISKFPDFRNTINNIQQNIKNNELSLTSLGSNSTDKIKELLVHMKSQDFNELRKWVVDNAQSNDGHLIRRAIYDNLKNFISPNTIPQAILLINQYDYRESHVIDREVNMVAFLCDVMYNVEFL